MSTKTTFKRIALVAVAALGLGVLATAPSQAVVSASSLTLSSATSTQNTGETSTAAAAVATLSYLNTDVADTVSVTAYLMSAPAGNVAAPLLQVKETSSATVDTTALLSTELAVGETSGQVAYVAGTGSAKNVIAKFNVYMDRPAVAGTYVVKLVPGVVAPSTGAINTDGVTLTITVAAAPYPDSTSTSYIAAGTASPAGADSATITAVKTISGTTVATITTTQNIGGVATANPESLTAIVTGPGTITAGGVTGRALTVKYDNTVALKADGASGVSTVTITGASSGRVYGTKTVTYFGDATAATAKAVKPILNPASAGQGAVLVNLTDASGTTVSGTQTFYVTSSDTTKVAGTYASQSKTYSAINLATDGVTNLGAGYLVTLDGVAAGTASVTVGTKSSATATTGVNAAPVSVRVGSETAASVKVSLDKTSYAPGEKATLTVALFDATGLPVANKTYSGLFATGGIVSSYALGATSDSITGTDAVVVDGVAEYTIYMPVSEKDVKFSWKTGTTILSVANQGVAGSITASFTSSAIEAANAATTAALAANDAVDALAATVAKLVANLKAQITALTKLIVKIQKKVGA